MKRWVLRICVFLLLGAIVNVAVAWGIALLKGGDARTYARALQGGSTSWSIYSPLRSDHIDWLAWMGYEWRHPDQYFWYRIAPVEVKTQGLAQTAYYEFRELMPYSNGRNPQVIHPFAIELQMGWPALSLADDLWEDTSGGAYHIGRWVHRRGITIETERDRLAAPLRPLWPGFAINTVFYAALLWLLLAGPFMVRRWRRIRRGLCPKCAYDLRGSAGETCPECGTRIAPSPPALSLADALRIARPSSGEGEGECAAVATPEPL